MDRFERSELLLGSENMNIIKNKHIAVFGAGGVGGYVLEALARCAVGSISIFDNDTVSLNNINRQILATSSTVGKLKVDVAKERLQDINPNINIYTHSVFYLPDNADEFDLSKYDYIVDAIDTVTSKLELIVRANKLNIPIISCMGTGNKLDPFALKITDLYKTSMCPLAKVMRKECKNRNIKKLKVLYSTEQPVKTGTNTPSSVSFVPSCAGLMIASEVIKSFIS